MKTFRLAAFMLIGAFMACLLFVSPVGRPWEVAQRQLPAALLGAFAGLGAELLLRLGQPAEKRFWHFTTRDVLVAMAIAAIG